MKLFLIFSALFSVTFCQHLLSLSTDFNGDNAHNPFNQPAPYGIFVSAYSDSQANLNKIFVVQKDGTQKSLSSLKQNSGKLTPYTITDSAYLTTTLTKNQLASLNGVIYLASTAQLNNRNFAVYDISGVINLSFQTVFDDTTSLFLNTYMNTNPYKSSVISQWKQSAGTSAYLYAGTPSDDAEPINYQIFSNPMHTEISEPTQSVFIPNVEKFSLATTNAFYLKTSNGGPSFRIEPGYFNIDGSTTTAVTTTGFYMKPQGAAETTVTVHVKRDTKYSGTCGASTVGKLQTLGKVSVSINDGASSYDNNVAPNPFGSPWHVAYIGENFKISSKDGKSGFYYVQYFVQQGPLKSQTTGPGAPTVPGRVETTTKSTGTIQVFVALMLSVAAFL